MGGAFLVGRGRLRCQCARYCCRVRCSGDVVRMRWVGNTCQAMSRCDRCRVIVEMWCVCGWERGWDTLPRAVGGGRVGGSPWPRGVKRSLTRVRDALPLPACLPARPPLAACPPRLALDLDLGAVPPPGPRSPMRDAVGENQSGEAVSPSNSQPIRSTSRSSLRNRHHSSAHTYSTLKATSPSPFPISTPRQELSHSYSRSQSF